MSKLDGIKEALDKAKGFSKYAQKLVPEGDKSGRISVKKLVEHIEEVEEEFKKKEM